MSETPVKQETHGPRRRGGWALVVVAVVVGLVAGGAAGALAATMTGGSDAPTQPRDVPSQFPDASRRFLPDLTASALRTWITGNDFECEEDTGAPSGATHWLICRSPAHHNAFASVEVEYDDDAQVRVVRAACMETPRTDEEYCQSVFTVSAREVFADRPAGRKEARAWARDNIDNDAITVIDGVELKMDSGEHALWFRTEG